jgi:hypothetical protein
MGTRPVLYQPPGWSTTRIRVEKTFGMFYVPMTLATGLRTVAKTRTASITSIAMRGTMTSDAPTRTRLHDVILLLEVYQLQTIRD